MYYMDSYDANDLYYDEATDLTAYIDERSDVDKI